MRIRAGFELVFSHLQPTPMLLMVNIHPSRANDLIQRDELKTDPWVPVATYRDGFGNLCSRIVAPPGDIRLWSDAIVEDSGQPDVVAPQATQEAIAELPDEVLVFLLGSRYCETDLLSTTAWSLFGQTPPGWARVQAICDYVHQHLSFGYQHARPTKTAWEGYNEQLGVCRDFAHLAITLCRCMNIPARYCTGYLGDIGVPVADAPMDFAGWLEAYIDGRWYTFDPRNHVPRIGRILMARGRDAADVALTTTFGPNVLKSFRVWTDQVG